MMCKLKHNAHLQHSPVPFGGEFPIYLLYGTFLKIAHVFFGSDIVVQDHRMVEIGKDL